MKHTIRRLFNPFQANAWNGFLSEKFIELSEDQKSFHQNKIHRPFFDRRLSRKKKLTLLINCYQSASSLFKTDALSQILNHQGVKVFEFESKNKEAFHVVLSGDPQFCREGLFTLVFYDKIEKVLTLAFSINLNDKEPEILIGCIQGSTTDSLNRIRHITHEMFGLQPRAFLIYLIKLFANRLNIQKIEAISDSNHVYNSLRYRRRLQKKFQSYDLFWKDIGEQQANKNFKISVSLNRKPIEEYPSKKRSEHRKRFSLLDEIELKFDQFLKSVLN